MKTNAVCRLFPAPFLTLFLAVAATAFCAMPMTAHGQLIVNAGGPINEYSPSGTPLATPLITSTNYFGAMALSGTNLYIVINGDGSPNSSSIGEYSTSGALENGSLVTGLSDPSSIAVSDDGTTLFVADIYAGTVSTYDAATGDPIETPLISGLPGPDCVAVSGSNLYVLNGNYLDESGTTGSIGLYTTAGGILNPALITNLDAPEFLALSGSDIYVASAGLPENGYTFEGTVGEYTTSGTSGVTIHASLIHGLTLPQVLAVSGTDIYVSDNQNLDKYYTSGLPWDPVNGAALLPDSNPNAMVIVSEAQLSIAVNLTSTSDTTSGLITHIGDDLTYNFTWINSGNDTALNLIVETPVPTYIDATSNLPLQFPETDLSFNQYGTYIPPTSPTSNDAAVMWQVANLDPGYEQSVGLTVHIGTGVKTGQVLGIPNTYEVYSTTNQPAAAATGTSSGSPNVGSTVLAAVTLQTPVLTKIAPGTGSKPWKFTVTEPGPAGTTLQLQYSINGTDWVDLASTEKQAGDVFTLTATDVPGDATFFQVVAQQGGSSSQPSNYESLYAVDATIAEVTQTDPVKTTARIGKGIINIDAKQTLTLNVDRNATAIFAIHVDNNSRFPDSIIFTGGQNSSFFTAQFFAQAGTSEHPTIGADITQAVFGGTFELPFPSTAGFTVYLKVVVSDLAPIGWSGEFTMEMVSAADAETSDFVKGVVDVTEPKHTVYVANTNDSGPDSLRAAITFADANKGTTIDFAIPTTDPGFVEVSGGQQFIITPATLLPPITGHGTTLDGSSQTNATGNTNTAGPVVAIVGPGTNQTTQENSFLYGLALGSSECVVKGIEIDKCYAGIGIAGPKTKENTIQGCQFVGDANSGVSISFGANTNTIGGASTGEGNTFLPLAGELPGVGVLINGANGNLVYGNTIGNLTNGGQENSISLVAGVQVSGGAQENYIGGVSAGMGNVISGNLLSTVLSLAPVGEGVWITDAGTNSNFVLGNRIGTAADGNSAVPNLVGVEISDGASGNYVGSSVTGGGNTISGNLFEGVEIESGTTTGNVVAGNCIGTNPVGNGAIPNGSSGVLVSYAGDGNIIGGKKPEDRNIISGNSVEGIRINSSNDTIIQNNLIGTAFNGTSPIPNGTSGAYDGIILHIASRTSMTDNTVAFNTSDGIEVSDTGNTIRQNSIFDNGNLGIELDDPAIANNPNLTNAYVNGTKTIITGDISGVPKSVYYIDFYKEIALDNLGSGEGETFIGSGTLKTDASGNASFNFSFPKAYADSYVTATVTGKDDGSTSEFSNTLLVAPNP